MLGEFPRGRHCKLSRLVAESLNQAAVVGVPWNNGRSRAVALRHGGPAIETQLSEDGRSARTVTLVAMLCEEGAHMLLEQLQVLRRYRLRLRGGYRVDPKRG